MIEQEKYDWMVYVSCMTYNQASYIEDAMNGFTMQETDFPFVCAIVDDASTDGEQEVIKNYLNEHFDLEDKKVARHEETDDYVLTFARHNINMNCYFAVLYLKYNHYNKKSKGPYLAQWRDNAKYIALCEGDDYWVDEKKLQKQVFILEEHKDYVLSHTRFNRLYQQDGSLEIDTYSHFNILKTIEHNSDPAVGILLGYQYLVQTCTVLYLAAAFDEIKNEFSLKYAGKFLMTDSPLWCFLSRKGKFHYLEEATAVYRINDGSACRQPLLKNRLRFNLSSAEMRVTVADDLGLSDQLVKHFNKQYVKELIKYLPFDRCYKMFVPLKTTGSISLLIKIVKLMPISLILKIIVSVYYRTRLNRINQIIHKVPVSR